MVSFLVSWVCTTALMNDCQVWADQSWQGSQAPVACDTAKPAKLAELQRDYRNFYVRVECETEKTGE